MKFQELTENYPSKLNNQFIAIQTTPMLQHNFKQAKKILILYGISATLGMFAVILLDSGIWKAISFALMILAIIGIGYKDLIKSNKDDKLK